MTIYDSSGAVIFDAPITKDAIIRNTLMGDYYIEIPFEVTDIMPFGNGCYILYKGRKFEIMSNVYAEPILSRNGYKYTLRFESQQGHLKRCRVFWTAGGVREVSFQNTTTLSFFGELIVERINAFLGTTNWSFGGAPADLEEQTKLVSFNGDSCWDALSYIAETFGVEWWTVENGDQVQLYFGKLEIGTPEEFKAGDVVSSIPSRSGDDAEYGTRFYVYGSTRNLPDDYKATEQGGTTNHISQKRLHLPDGIEYIDAWDNLKPEDVVEQVVFFEDVFPKNTETVTGISTVDREIIEGQTDKAYVMECADTPFTPENMIEGEVLGCTFTSGSLIGRSFELSINQNDFDKKFEIIAQTEGTDDFMIVIPNESLKPKVGDTFILTGVQLPQERVIEASQELLDKGKSWAVKHSSDTNVYDCPTNAIYCHRNDKNYEVGQKVLLVGKQFGSAGRESRIQAYEKKLYDEYQATYTVGDNTAYSRFGSIEKNIEQKAYSERIGVVQGVGVYVIRSKYDTTPPSDESVYSALASETLFLSKKKGGTVQGPVTFSKTVILEDGLSSEDFDGTGPVGSGFGITRDANGNSVITADILRARKKAEFYELVINQTSFELGETVKSLAGCEITSVEEVADENIYRCYYDNKAGKRYSGFNVGDQARCQRYDADFGEIIKYYWRVVKFVGDDYVDLYIAGQDDNGVSLVDGDGIPSEGDNIVQFGHRTDPTRQTAIVIASTPTPTILQYVGINSFDLPYPVTKISPNNNVFTGEVHIGAGSTGIENLDGLPDAIADAIGDIEVGKYNLLRNSGFTGDYLSKQLTGDTTLNGDSQMFSPSLVHWTYENATTQASEVSASGVEVSIANGFISQSLMTRLIAGESYILSFKAKGTTLSYSVGDVSKTIALTSEYVRYVEQFDALEDSTVFNIFDADCVICEIQLERGTVASSWGYSMWDNTSELAKYQSLQYLVSALANGSTTINGGLILSNLLALGNYVDGEMKQVTSGLNGTYNNDNDVAFWSGGDLEQAIATVAKIKSSPRYYPTDEEWANMAKFVVTHGGDAFMRGYIYALGGIFKGTVDIAGGKIRLDEDGSGSVANNAIMWDEYGRLTSYYPVAINWISVQEFTDGVITHDKGGYILANALSGNSNFELSTPTLSPYLIRVQPPQAYTRQSAATTINGNFKLTNPNGTEFIGNTIKIGFNYTANKGSFDLAWDGVCFNVLVPASVTISQDQNNDNADLLIY